MRRKCHAAALACPKVCASSGLGCHWPLIRAALAAVVPVGVLAIVLAVVAAPVAAAVPAVASVTEQAGLPVAPDWSLVVRWRPF